MKLHIKQFRDWIGITQTQLSLELSELFGDPDWSMHSGTISRIEAGRCIASLDTYRLLVAWAELQCAARGLDPRAHEIDWSDQHKPDSDFDREPVLAIARERVQGMTI